MLCIQSGRRQIDNCRWCMYSGDRCALRGSSSGARRFMETPPEFLGPRKE
jgi:hypothetical protein